MKINTRNGLPSIDDTYQSYYLSFVNDFLTIDGFAIYYNLSDETARHIIKEGKRINNSSSFIRKKKNMTLKKRIELALLSLRESKTSQREISLKTGMPNSTI